MKSARWRGVTAALGGALVLALVQWACGGNSPTEPTPPPSNSGGTGGPPASAITITLSSAGASASATDLAVGGTVTVVNNDSVSHEMSSNPHPAHTDCPGLNFGPLAPGQSRTSAAVTTARSCGMHDHANPGTQSLMRTITIR